MNNFPWFVLFELEPHQCDVALAINVDKGLAFSHFKDHKFRKIPRPFL